MGTLASARTEIPVPTVETLPVEEIKPGMTGEWKTVISGSEIETFHFEVLGVSRNFIGPQRDVIIAKATDKSQILSGPVAGMSGSPCYIDGKLVGAYAYGYTWPKEQAIIGITPIADMFETLGKEAHRTPDKARKTPAAAPLPRQQDIQQAQGKPEAQSSAAMESVLSPLPTPLMISGISAQSLNAFADEFAERGLAPVNAPLGFTSELSAADLESGSPVAGVLMTGDFQMAGVGTVTWREGDQLLAFGHPFFGSGDEHMPMAPAEIITVIQSVPRSFKLSNVGEPVGTIYQDRLSAIAGKVGPIPAMTDYEITVNSPGETTRTFQSRIYQHRQYTPLLAAIALLEGLSSTMEAADEHTFYTRLSLDITGHEPLELEYVGTGGFAAFPIAIEFMNIYSQLLNNPFEMADVTKVSVEIEQVDERFSSTLHAIQNQSGTLRPGDQLELSITLNNYLEDKTKHHVSIPIPQGTTDEELIVFVGDARASDRLELAGLPATVQSLSGILDYLRQSRSNQRIYVKLLRRADGLVVDGQRLADLPLSVQSVLDSERSPTELSEIHYATLWETSIELPGVFSGSYNFKAHIQ